VEEYRLRQGQSVLSEPIPFPQLYSAKEWYEYVIDQALRGQWFPFAKYVAQKKGVNLHPVDVKSFSLSPEQFDQVLKGNRVQKQILWDRILFVVGSTVLTGIIIKGLMELYKRYKKRKLEQDKEKLIVVQLEVPELFNQTQIQAVEQAIKVALGIDLSRPFELVKSINRRSIRSQSKSRTTRSITKTSVYEMVLKHTHQPSQEDLTELVKKIMTELNILITSQVILNAKVSSGTSKRSAHRSLKKESMAALLVQVR
jgi:hypothetical protein